MHTHTCKLARPFPTTIAAYEKKIPSVTTEVTPEDCTEDQFFCDDDCHPISIRCDGRTDCADHSDEEGCARPTRRPPTYPCPQHTCPDGQCYSESERCDGISQCADGSDEAQCKL